MVVAMRDQYQRLTYELSGTLARITLNNPPLNVMGPQFVQDSGSS